MRAAAEHLGLAEGAAPTTTQYQQAMRETQLDMSFREVYDAFGDSWRTATSYYRGEPVRESAAQTEARHRNLGRVAEHTMEPALAGVRLFLQRPNGPEPSRRADYEAWAADFNQNSPHGYRPVRISTEAITDATHLTWDRAKRVALAGEATLEEAQRESLEEWLDEAGPLVHFKLLCTMLGRSRQAKNTRQLAGLPKPVVTLGGSHNLWRRGEIEAFRDQGRRFAHPAGNEQAQWLDRPQLAARLDVLPVTVKDRVARGDWDRVPRPAGRAGTRYYWEARAVDRWLARHQ